MISQNILLLPETIYYYVHFWGHTNKYARRPFRVVIELILPCNYTKFIFSVRQKRSLSSGILFLALEMYYYIEAVQKSYHSPEGGGSRGRENGLFYLIFKWKAYWKWRENRGGGVAKLQNMLIWYLNSPIRRFCISNQRRIANAKWEFTKKCVS